jgi:hypothetical protein
MLNLAELNENTPLSDLAAAIRRFNQVILDHQRSALRTSLDLGDALACARARVATRRWKAWRAEHCPALGKRRDEVCRQLAACRPIIERAIGNDPDLSISGALKLITVPKPRPAKPNSAELEKWRALSAEEKRAGLAADGIGALLEYLPPELKDALADRVERVRHKTVRDRGLSELLREHIAKNPEDQLTKHIRAKQIDLKRIMVHVAEIDAPARRRPPLVTIAARAIQEINPVNSVH